MHPIALIGRQIHHVEMRRAVAESPNTPIIIKLVSFVRQEMLQIVRSLFKCESPFIGLDGDPCVILFEPDKIFKL